MPAALHFRPARSITGQVAAIRPAPSPMERTPTSPASTEQPFDADELFFSATDRKGSSRAGTASSCASPATAREELVGRAHNLVRHPDMPRACSRSCGTTSRRAGRSRRTSRTSPRTATTTGWLRPSRRPRTAATCPCGSSRPPGSLGRRAALRRRCGPTSAPSRPPGRRARR